MNQRGDGKFLCALCALLFPFVAPTAASAADPRPPNIVFILADDLGYGDLGCYGQKRIETPHIDRLAKEGMRFTDFYAGCTVCAPSRCVLMTGYHMGHCWVRGNAGQQNRQIQCLRDEDVTIAEVLRKGGYATALCGKWGLGEEGTAAVPTKQGFDHFFGFLNQHHAHNYYPAYFFRGEERVPLKNVVPGKGEFGVGVASEKVEYSADLITAEALAWIDEVKGRPFFLYYAVTLPHANNEGGREGMEVPDLGQYARTDWPAPQKAHAAMISRLDADVGRLMEKLKQLGLDEHTLVFFSSDNGPHAEGGNDPSFNHSSGPLRGTKRDLTEGGIRVPFIARWPGKIAGGTTSNQVGSFADIMPTLAELSTTTGELPKNLDGLSIVPTLLGRPAEQKQHNYLYWAFYERGGAQAVRQGKWKAVQQPLDSPVRLYDLSADLHEDRNLAAEHPEIVSRLTAAMREAYVASENWKFSGQVSPAANKKKVKGN
ncbi:MAG: arylsulfatase [Planctomycetaceae bacterium]|nr:arylsulfatase [Planctomycetaceae bacterium]